MFRCTQCPKIIVCREWRWSNHDKLPPPKTLLLAYLIRCSLINIFLTSSRPGTAYHFLEASTRAGSRHVAFPPPLLPIKSPCHQILWPGHSETPPRKPSNFWIRFKLPLLQPRLQPRHHAFPTSATGRPGSLGTPRSSLPRLIQYQPNGSDLS